MLPLCVIANCVWLWRIWNSSCFYHRVVAACMILFAFLSYLFFKTEKVLQQSLAMQAVVLIAMFIGLYWNGFFVTILWVAFPLFYLAGESSVIDHGQVSCDFANDRYVGKARHL
jgi:hypothetical protein